MDNDFTIGETRFKVSKINALKQFQIVRRIAPIMTDLLPAIAKLPKQAELDKLTVDQQMEKMVTIGQPLMTGLAKLSEEDSNYVFLGLLAAVEMKQGGETGPWSKLVRDGNLMFDTLELPTLMGAAGKALMFNLSGFFAALPRVSS